jgi:Uma2 family endonuclease
MVAKPQRMTIAEYLAMEEASEEKHEYVRGYVYPLHRDAPVGMSGADPKHVLINLNLGSALRGALLDRPCVALGSDQRVLIEATEVALYPDLTVVCGGLRFAASSRTSIVNPMIVVEILSPSTAAYDRGKKFDHYASLESVKEYVLVSSGRVAVDHFLRESNGTWRFTSYRGLDEAVRFPSIDAAVPLREIYAKIEAVAPDGFGDEESPYPLPVEIPRR